MADCSVLGVLSSVIGFTLVTAVSVLTMDLAVLTVFASAVGIPVITDMLIPGWSAVAGSPFDVNSKISVLPTERSTKESE